MSEKETFPHCLMCGDKHKKGKCPPENFAYFKCNQCGQIINMPWDAALMMGTGEIQCGCGAMGSFESTEETNGLR